MPGDVPVGNGSVNSGMRLTTLGKPYHKGGLFLLDNGQCRGIIDTYPAALALTVSTH